MHLQYPPSRGQHAKMHTAARTTPHGPAYLCHLADVRLQGQLPHQGLEQLTPLLASAAWVLNEVAALRGWGWGGGSGVGWGPGALALAQTGSRSKQPMH